MGDGEGLFARSTRYVSETDAARYRERGYWSASETVPSQVARWARERPGVPAVVDDLGGRFTYAELHDASSRLAAALVARGVRAGDVVGIQLPNRAEASITAIAVEKAGAIVCPLVPAYRTNELLHICAKTGMRVLFSPGTYRGHDHDSMSADLVDQLDTLELVVSIGTSDTGRGIVEFDALLDDGADARRFDEPALDPDALAGVLFTSGTESTPKAILHSHNTLLAHARALVTMLDLTSDDGVFMASPVGHGTGYGFGIRLAAFLGSTLALQVQWDPAKAAKAIREYGSVYTHGATPFVMDMLRLPDDERNLAPLRYFVTGGAAVPPGTATRVHDECGCHLLRLYGQTEGFMSTLNRPTDAVEKIDTTDGRPVDGVEVRAVDDDGNDVPVGTPGNCLYRGPHRCVGFLDDEERAAASFTADGWFRAGDLVSVDQDGFVKVAGRTKEVINRGGYKYSPREVEDLLSLHPHIRLVAIVAMPDERLVERACAFVIPEGEHHVTVEELGGFLGERSVATYKWPERVEIVDTFPTTASGKVQKHVLGERFRSGSAG